MMNALAALCVVVCFATSVLAGSSSCDIGQYWYNIPGTLSWVSSGDAGVWGVTSSGSIFYRLGSYIGSADSAFNYNYDGRNYGFPHVDGSSWQLVAGTLTQLDVGRNSVWGVTAAYQVFYRSGISQLNQPGNTWNLITGLSAIHVSVSDVDGKVWAVGTNYLVYRRVGISDELPAGTSWEYVSGISSVRYIDVGGAGVWATTTNSAVYYRIGSRKDCQGSSWQYVPGTLNQVASGGDAVWGVHSSGAIYYRFNVTVAQPTGIEWIQVPGVLKELSVSTSNNALWGVTTGGLIYNRRQ